MGRPKKEFDVHVNAAEATIDALAAGVIPRADLPQMLARAKADGDAPLIAAIMAACSV